MPMSRKRRILCVDDHAIVRQGLAALVSAQPDLEVVGLAASGKQAVALFRERKPDVTIMDLQLPIMSGLDAIKTILQESPEAKIIVLTMYQGEEDVHRALKAGAASYLLKDSLADDLIDTIRRVDLGERPIHPRVRARLEHRAQQPPLSPREIEVLELISKGLRNKEVAARLNTKEETVHSHVKSIFSKFEVNDRTAAVHMALKRGIIHLDGDPADDKQ